jgi:hypothetical protein
MSDGSELFSSLLGWLGWIDLRTILPENGPLKTDVRNEWG